MAFGSGGGGGAIQGRPTLPNLSHSLEGARAGGPRSTPKSAARAAPVLRGLRVVPGPLLSVRTAAEALGLSRATVYALIDRGELPHVRLSRNGIRIRPADLAAYVARGIR